MVLGQVTYPGGQRDEKFDPSISWWHWRTVDPMSFHSGIGFGAVYPKPVDQLTIDAKHKFFSDNEVNNLLTAIEFPQLVNTLGDIKSLVTSTLFRRKLPKIAQLRNLYLGYSFGIAPLVSDLRKMSKILPQLRQRLNEHKRKAGQAQVVSAKSVGTLTCTLGPGALGYYGVDSPPSNYSGGLWWHGPVQNTGPLPTRTVRVKGIDKTSYQTDVFSDIDMIMKTLITTGPATLAWELVPFSFVADWFVNTSALLDKIDNAITGNTKKIIEMWVTERWEGNVLMYFHPYGSFYNKYTSSFDNSLIGTRKSSYYHRKPIGDISIVGLADLKKFLSGRFGKKQVALSAALLHQIVANTSR
jgi:hypothetical protein